MSFNVRSFSDRYDSKKAGNITHVYQKKNINNTIDSRYQEGILTIVNFISEIKVTLVNKLMSDYLLDGADIIKINYENGNELRKYNGIMQQDSSYFRLNYLVDGQVTYRRHSLGLIAPQSNSALGALAP